MLAARRSPRAWLLIAGIGAGCGPKSAVEALPDNVGHVCELLGGPCNGAPPLDSPEDLEWLDMCVESQIEVGGGRIREEQGEPCFRKYAELYACAGKWTCDEYLQRVDDPCTEINDDFNAECGGLSPFGE